MLPIYLHVLPSEYILRKVLSYRELIWWHYLKRKELKGEGRKAKTRANYPVVSTAGYSEGLRIACLEHRRGDHLSTVSCSQWSSAIPWNVNSLMPQVYACTSTEWFGRCPKAWLQKDPGGQSKWCVKLRPGGVPYSYSTLLIAAGDEVNWEVGTNSFSWNAFSFHDLNLLCSAHS